MTTAATIPSPAPMQEEFDGVPEGSNLTHLDLPDRDPTVMENQFENPQTTLLNETMFPHLVGVYGADNFLMCANSGIYYRVTVPPLRGCLAPDWFLVPNTSPQLPEGGFRRSYVLWNEFERPLLVIEYVSRDGAEERDRTPREGKFWLYEHTIQAGYYAIFDPRRGTLEVWRLEGGVYQPVQADAHDRFPIAPMRIELGLWQGNFHGIETQWLRAWDAATGQLLPTGMERAEAEHRRADEQRRLADEQRRLADEQRRLADEQRQRADAAERAAEALRDRLRAAGIDPDA